MIKNKISSVILSKGVSALMIAGVGMLAGCVATESTNKSTNDSVPGVTNTPAVYEDVQSLVMRDFKTLLEKNPKPDAVIAYLDKNISRASKENASAMIAELEIVQKKSLSGLEEKYSKNEATQSKLDRVWRSGFDLKRLDSIQDKELKELLLETRESGFRVETAEGMYFPIMNYEFYKKFDSYVTPDLKAYIDIMAVESAKVPAKDAALVISWEEVVKRAMAQEEFIKTYGNSVKAEDIKLLKKKYITFILYGLNNTPIFSYESKVMVPGAKNAYSNALKNAGDSEVKQMLGKYMDLLARTDYKLTEEVEKFRKSISDGRF